MNTQTISTKALREDFSTVVDAMASGQPLLLLYRSKPLAKLVPVARTRPRPRSFTLRELKRWIADDQVTAAQQARIDAIIRRLP